MYKCRCTKCSCSNKISKFACNFIKGITRARICTIVRAGNKFALNVDYHKSVRLNAQLPNFTVQSTASTSISKNLLLQSNYVVELDTSIVQQAIQSDMFLSSEYDLSVDATEFRSVSKNISTSSNYNASLAIGTLFQPITKNVSTQSTYNLAIGTSLVFASIQKNLTTTRSFPTTLGSLPVKISKTIGTESSYELSLPGIEFRSISKSIGTSSEFIVQSFEYPVSIVKNVNSETEYSITADLILKSIVDNLNTQTTFPLNPFVEVKRSISKNLSTSRQFDITTITFPATVEKNISTDSEYSIDIFVADHTFVYEGEAQINPEIEQFTTSDEIIVSRSTLVNDEIVYSSKDFYNNTLFSFTENYTSFPSNVKNNSLSRITVDTDGNLYNLINVEKPTSNTYNYIIKKYNKNGNLIGTSTDLIDLPSSGWINLPEILNIEYSNILDGLICRGRGGKLHIVNKLSLQPNTIDLGAIDSSFENFAIWNAIVLNQTDLLLSIAQTTGYYLARINALNSTLTFKTLVSDGFPFTRISDGKIFSNDFIGNVGNLKSYNLTTGLKIDDIIEGEPIISVHNIENSTDLLVGINTITNTYKFRRINTDGTIVWEQPGYTFVPTDSPNSPSNFNEFIPYNSNFNNLQLFDTTNGSLIPIDTTTGRYFQIQGIKLS